VRQDLDRLMKERGLSGLVVFAYDRVSPAMYYVTGQRLHYGVYFRAADGRAHLIHDPMERDQAAAAGCEHSSFPAHRLPQLQEDEGTPARAFGRLIGEHCASMGIRGKVGLFGEVPAGFGHALVARAREVNAGLEVHDANPDLLSSARLTKSDDEAEAIRRVSRDTAGAMNRLRAFLETLVPDGQHFRHEGRPVLLGDLRTRLKRDFLEHGLAEDGESIVSLGRDAGVPHNRGNDVEPLRAGASMIVDIFPGESAGGYHSDMTRTFCMGVAPAPLREIYDDVRRAFDEVMAALKAGQPCRIYQEMVCASLEARGHATLRTQAGPEEGYVHSLGHGVGLAVHEAPRLGGPPSNTQTLDPRMVVSVEPGLYYPSRGMGVRIEDLVYVRPDGSIENLTVAPYELEVLPRG
jgi:Xaa-Pro aminopeptidase